jgi:hypothetical protein
VGDGTRTRDNQIHSLADTTQKEPESQQISHIEASACGPACGSKQEDPHLRRVVEMWPALPEAIRRAVLALVDTVA